MHHFTRADMIAMWIGASYMGILCGLFPLLVGKNRKEVVLGRVGFVCVFLCQLLLGMSFALPVALLFCFVIVLSSRCRWTR